MQPSQQTRLIINADDFGMTPGINRSVFELNAAGALTSATLMANGAAFRNAVHGAFVQTTLAVGCHVVLVDGQPTLPYKQISSLADANGFHPTLGSFLSALQRGRIRTADIEAEATAQIRRIQSSGITVSHIDTHKHTHMFARVLRPVLRAAIECGVSAIRNPFEPAWSVKATEARDWGRRLQVVLLRSQRGRFVKAVKQAGLATTDGAAGVLATGELSLPIVRRLMAAMPPGTWELVCHPGYQDDALSAIRTRLRESREQEQAALLQVFAEGDDNTPELISFASLAKHPASFPLARASYGRR